MAPPAQHGKSPGFKLAILARLVGKKESAIWIRIRTIRHYDPVGLAKLQGLSQSAERGFVGSLLSKPQKRVLPGLAQVLTLGRLSEKGAKWPSL